MANMESRYCHTLDFGIDTVLEYLAIEVPYSLILTFTNSSKIWKLEVNRDNLYELKNITVSRITIGAATEEKALFTYKKSGS